MKLGFIGLGRMGAAMTASLLEKKHELVVTDLSEDAVNTAVAQGATAAESLSDLVAKLEAPRVVWVMVPNGEPTDTVIDELGELLEKGDIVIDGGNSYYENTIKNGEMLADKGITMLDCGTSGGIEGARHGACMMIGGDKKAFDHTEQLYKDMCVEDGYGYMGTAGGGHFVKMVHNAIEYGMMGAIAEGVQVVNEMAGAQFETDINEVVKVYAHGSIIESRLMSWLEDSFDEKGYMDAIEGEVPRGETEGEMEELEKKTSMPMLTAARQMRVGTRDKASFAGQMLAAMRNQFGGHAVKKK